MERSEPRRPSDGFRLTRSVGRICNHPTCRCVTAGVHGGLPAMDWDTYRCHVDAAAADADVERLVLPGAESTLDADFLRRVRYARDSGGFRHIRVESSGHCFADLAFAQATRDAGADELHIAVPAHNAECAGAITGAPERFAPLLVGLENIRRVGGTLFTCSVVCNRNVAHLTELAALLRQFQPARVEIYNLIPVRPDHHHLLAPLSTIEPALCQAVADLASASTPTTLTWFPRCIFDAGHDPCGAAHMAGPVLSEAACGVAAQHHCFYGRACTWFGDCKGLAETYIQRFGWEIDRLRPHEVVQGPPDASGSTSRLQPQAPMRDGENMRWLELLAGPDGMPLERTSLWSLETVTRQDRRVRYRFLAANGERYELVLEPRNEHARRLAQTAGFNVMVLPVGSSDRRLIRRLLFTLLPIISRNDDGRLRLD